MVKHRTYSVEFKRQIAQEYLGGETLHGLARRHSISRNLIRIWVDKYEAGQLDEDVELAANLEAYEAKIAALERKVGQLTMELEFLKKTEQQRRRQRSALPSVVSGPKASPSGEDVN